MESRLLEVEVNTNGGQYRNRKGNKRGLNRQPCSMHGWKEKCLWNFAVRSSPNTMKKSLPYGKRLEFGIFRELGPRTTENQQTVKMILGENAVF